MTRRPSLSARIYRFLTRLYPSDFRWHHGLEMNRLFEEVEMEEGQHRWGLFCLWSAMLCDILRTLPREHLDMLLQDVRYTFRSLVRNPGFSGTAVLTLMIAIAANSVIFSIVHAVLIQPLPFTDPDQLILLRTDLPQIGLSDGWLSEPEVLDLRERAQSFSGLAVFRSNRVILANQESVEPLTAGRVSANFLAVLGVTPLLGRGFLAEEELPTGPGVALLSYDLWQTRFGADPDILGQTLQLDERRVTVVGVTPEGFRPEFPRRTRLASGFDLWLPYQVSYQEQDRHSHSLTVLARMKPEISLSAAQNELDSIASLLEDLEYQKTGFRLKALPFQEDLTAEARPALLALLAAVVLVLLISCSNVANLLLARNSVRSREIAIRVAVGARSTRLARQILTESSILALMGGSLGVGLAFLSLPLLLAFSPANIPGIDGVRINGSVLIFTLGCCAFAALFFSLAPTLQTSRQNRHLNRALRSRHGAAGSGQASRRLLIVAEVALVFVLLIAGGLMFQTLRALHQEDLGYQPEGVLTVELNLPTSSYSRDTVAPFFEELEQRIRSLPGVREVGANMQLPLSGSSWSGTDTFYETTNNQTDTRQEHFEVDQRVITPGYFPALGTSLLAGRFFSEVDTQNSPPVVIIDENLAERVWPGADPVGQRMARGASPDEPFFFEVIGVVEHQRYQDLRLDGRPQVYFAQSQLRFDSLTLVVQSAVEPASLIEPIRSQIQEMDPNLPIDAIQPLGAAVDQALAPTRFTLTLLAMFAAIGLLLAAIGIFGVVNFSVNQQTREIAIRMTMGAPSGTVLRAAVGQALGLAGFGILTGSLASLGVNRFLESMLFGVSICDGMTFFLVTLLCLGFALLASLPPALRATRVDPVVALRGE